VPLTGHATISDAADGAALILAHDMESILADIDYGECSVEYL
jgi:hypothetical protein